MSAVPLLIEFSERGIRLRVEGPELALTAPKGSLDADLVSRVKQDKAEILNSLEKIQAKAGRDWGDIADDPEQLKTFADLLAIENMRQCAIVPEHYVSTTVCKHCGPVPIWEGCPAEVIGCPWCFNRLQGLPIPRL